MRLTGGGCSPSTTRVSREKNLRGGPAIPAHPARSARGASLRDGALVLSAPGVREFVILRSDGTATYHWATAVDDLDLGITDVIRGNDHLSNTPLQVAAIRSL